MKNKGFTLIELLAVIVILAIISVIAIPRILNVVDESKKGAAESSALGYIDAIEKQIMINAMKNSNTIADGEYDDVVDFDETNNIVVKGNLPTAGEITISKGKIIDATICIGGYTVSYNGSKASVSSKCSTSIPASPDSILGKIANTTFTNNTVVNITAHGKTYSARVYNVEGNTTLSGENVYGTADDVATASREAVNMVILKVNGDLTINSGATVRPYYTEYGGPKGFIIYVTGKLTNNGTIDNSHGAKATGEDVYLWKNRNKTYETVPAIGASGAPALTTAQGTTDGVAGDNGVNRQTGGGGNGRISGVSGYNWSKPGKRSGAGGAGTSYSGGSGGGAIMVDEACALDPASSIGGEGGSALGVISGTTTTCTSDSYYQVVGGVGNPGGTGAGGGTVNHTNDGANGTGGLLVIYANDIDNKATISANGTNNKSGYRFTGGGSGAGSINIFYYNSYVSTGTISAIGGTDGKETDVTERSGFGGNGSITIGSVRTASFVANS